MAPEGVKGVDGTALAVLVGWAIRLAMAFAQTTGLPEDELEGEALYAIDAALRTHRERGATVSEHVRRRVKGALLDTARKHGKHRQHEVLLDDTEAAERLAVEDDDEALTTALGVGAQVMASPEESLLHRERQALLDQAVERLPPADCRLYVLRHREERTWDGISAELGIPDRTARDHDKRIRGHLTAVLRARFDED
jgi:RNA polymerase sigma factor (sigma-70 family)